MGEWLDRLKAENKKKSDFLHPKKALDTIDNMGNSTLNAPAPPSYQSGWEKVFPANNDPDQTIYWRKDGARIPVEPSETIAFMRTAKLTRYCERLLVTK